jgi:hypothetical protein
MMQGTNLEEGYGIQEEKLSKKKNSEGVRKREGWNGRAEGWNKSREMAGLVKEQEWQVVPTLYHLFSPTLTNVIPSPLYCHPYYSKHPAIQTDGHAPISALALLK